VERNRRAVEEADEKRWLDGQSSEARKRLGALRTLTDAEMQQSRAGLSLGRQLDQALADASLLSGVAASQGGGESHSGKPSSRGPGRIAGALYAHGDVDVATLYGTVIGQLIANLQREIDRARLGSLADHRKLESSAEKTVRLLRDWAGIRSEIVAVLDPSLGSSRSIEQMRRREGFRPIDGTERK
jgi:hypothetical protein